MPILDSPRPSRLPYPEHSVPELLARSAHLWPDAIALVDGATDAEYSFARLHEGVRGMARALQDEGIEKGDRVAIVAPNSPEWVVVFQGALLAVLLFFNGVFAAFGPALLGLDAQIAWQAHLGGFAAGLVLGYPPRRRSL